MAQITLAQAAEWCGGTIDPKYADICFLGANNDSRNIQPGQLFVALNGARDGHDFIPMAIEKGAAAVLCTRSVGDYPSIVVEDTRLALGQIAREERNRLGMKVVGVTGSVGKSTTKEMIVSVLETKYRVAKTPANHNNDIGMPMAILSIPEDTEVAVLEMGMNHFREIAYLSSIGQPDVAVIINIGTMHIEHLGSKEGILQAKLEILEGLRPDGKLLLNGDDEMLWPVRNRLKVPALYFGAQNPEAAVIAEDINVADCGVSFVAQTEQGAIPVNLSLEGQHYVLDALAAVSAGLQFGVSPSDITAALSNFRNMAGRQEIFETNGYTVIKDCYNAGPESMAAALAVLGKKPGRRIAVLGDMLELGKRAAAEHYRIGRIAVEHADIILAYGPHSDRVVDGAITGGMDTVHARAFDDREKLVDALKAIAKPQDVLLFKGSHGMHMELALDLFLQTQA
ncbi:MAG: UDP-N-acetylmuramoyl-tripeptide--D-alanyl-D-alanine ligase [Ruminococcaceae bacterium]|nr:UDP-N-acetylmuramoyl-tripeptide--D-alanyl-D-alanine ligase [Oscillospiraceae bacterium]